MTAGAAPAPDRRDMDALAEVISEKIVNRIRVAITDPMQKEISNMSRDVAVLKQAVIGNGSPGLMRRFEDAEERHEESHSAMHARINGLSMRLPEAARDESQEEKDNSEFRQKLVGIWIGVSATIGACSGVIALGVTIYKETHR